MYQTLSKMMSVWTSIAHYHTPKRSLKATQLTCLCRKDTDALDVTSVRFLVAYFKKPEDVVINDILLFTCLLPQVGKDIISGFTTGQYVNNSVFRNPRHSRPLPNLFDDVLLRFFTKKGKCRMEFFDEISITLQLFMTYYKFEVDFSDETLDKAKIKFIEDDSKVKKDGWPLTGPHSIDQVRMNFQSAFPDNPWDIRPHHSNGATNTAGITNLDKRLINRYIKPIANSPYAKYNENYTPHTDDLHQYSRLTFVPKDSRGPRTISMEPHERMKLQKGVLSLIVEFQEEHFAGTKGHINYTDQTINQHLAYLSSIDGKRATIDLKDASDMISWSLVKQLASTDWLEAFTVLRSEKVFVDNELLPLNKFASMGSALCFPVLATVIWSIARCYDPKCYVYGDDLICDAILAKQIMSALEDYGLRINKDKSFLTGPFRESCGGDYIAGYDVSYIKCKSHDLINYVEMCNLFAQRYSPSLGDSLVRIFEDDNFPVFRIPFNAEPMAGCYRTDILTPNDVFFKRRWNEDLQLVEYYFLSPSVIDLDLETRKSLKKKKSWIKRKNKSLYGPYLENAYLPSYYYDEWLTLSCPYNQPLFDDTFMEACRDTITSNRQNLFEFSSSNTVEPVIPGIIKFGAAKEKIGCSWGNVSALTEQAVTNGINHSKNIARIHCE